LIGRRTLLAVILLSVGTPIAAAEPSLILANWHREISVEPDRAECRASNVICLNVRVIVEFSDVEVITGPTLPATIRARLWYHVRPRKGLMLMLAITKSEVSGLEAYPVDLIRPNDQEACIDTDAITRLNITLPPEAHLRGSQSCFDI
jgi:hypothetical protein